MTLTAAVTAVICILAPIALPIPVSPVPLSLGSFVIMLAGCILGWKLGLVSCLLYLALGILGLPVFSAYGSGLAKVVGPTGGYLLGYIPLVILKGTSAAVYYPEPINRSMGDIVSGSWPRCSPPAISGGRRALGSGLRRSAP